MGEQSEAHDLPCYQTWVCVESSDHLAVKVSVMLLCATILSDRFLPVQSASSNSASLYRRWSIFSRSVVQSRGIQTICSRLLPLTVTLSQKSESRIKESLAE